ncbi:MAG TPA: POTRA domain-containing protein, partial [Terriglobales bacterium]|nr:POTRA domain-containing protein [Terriglobales bacterium]
MIEKIEFPGVAASDQPAVRALVTLHEGERLDRQTLQAVLRSLFASGRFANLRAECDRSPEGKVVLSFVSEPNFFIGRVAVQGAPAHPTESQIANASKLQLGELLTSQKIDRALQNIKRLLQENGFYHTTVTH